MDYRDFYNLFLLEMPIKRNGGNPYEPLCKGIELTIEYGGNIVALGNDTYNVGDFYWVGSSDGNIKDICCNVSMIGSLAKVNTTGKNPDLIGQPPYAMDFYLKISQSLGLGIKFASDQVLSDDGFKVWRNLLKAGHKILIYDNDSEKYLPKIVNNESDLAFYFNDTSHTYQYVLDENIGNIMGHFTLMEWKRLAGYPLMKLFGDSLNNQP